MISLKELVACQSDAIKESCIERGISFADGYSKKICYASGIDPTKEIPFISIIIQPPCYNSSHVEAFVTCHCALKDTKVGCTEVTMLNLAVNASTYEEGKVMQGRKMNTPHGSMCNISSFSDSYTIEKISNRRFRRIIETTPNRYLANSIEIL